MTEKEEKNNQNETQDQSEIDEKNQEIIEDSEQESGDEHLPEKEESEEEGIDTEEEEKEPDWMILSKEELGEKIESLEQKLEKSEEKRKIAEKDAEKWKDKYIRLQAEFENSQKRWERSRQELRKQYTASVLKSFLPLYDSFKKAIESEKNKKEIETLKQFFNQFLNIFRQEGAKPMDTKVEDKFDYNLHEALTAIENEHAPPNTILDVIQEGWMLNKDVLRFAKVVISKKPKPPEPESKKEGEKKEEDTSNTSEKEEKETKTESMDKDQAQDAE